MELLCTELRAGILNNEVIAVQLQTDASAQVAVSPLLRMNSCFIVIFRQLRKPSSQLECFQRNKVQTIIRLPRCAVLMVLPDRTKGYSFVIVQLLGNIHVHISHWPA